MTEQILPQAPAYRRLADELRGAILEGQFPPDRRLPTEAELTSRWKVSRQTARHAFDELVGEGLIYRVRGRGTFAAAASGDEKYLRSVGAVDDLLSLSVDSTLEVIEPLRPAVDIAAAGGCGWRATRCWSDASAGSTPDCHSRRPPSTCRPSWAPVSPATRAWPPVRSATRR
jgi:DNA-binding FadR family transcriptional regulator